MTMLEARTRLKPYVRLLGRLTDIEIGLRAGVSAYRVRILRHRLGVGTAPRPLRAVVHRPHRCSLCDVVGHNRRTCGSAS